MNEFVIKNGLIVNSGNSQLTGSLIVTNGITGSVTGSFAGDGSGLTGIIASAAPGGPTSSIQFNNSGSTSGSGQFTFDKFTNKVILTGSMEVSGSVSGSFSGSFSGDGSGLTGIGGGSSKWTGSTDISRLGNVSVTGSLGVTGSLIVSGALTGSIISASQVTGSLFGTSSWAVSASWAPGVGTTTGSYTGSFDGSHSGSFTGSFTGSLLGTSSYANNTDLFDGLNSTVFATTGSNVFVGTETITGSVNISGSTNITQVTGSFTGSLVGRSTGSFSGSFSGSYSGDGSPLTGVWKTTGTTAVSAPIIDLSNTNIQFLGDNNSNHSIIFDDGAGLIVQQTVSTSTISDEWEDGAGNFGSISNNIGTGIVLSSQATADPSPSTFNVGAGNTVYTDGKTVKTGIIYNASGYETTDLTLISRGYANSNYALISQSNSFRALQQISASFIVSGGFSNFINSSITGSIISASRITGSLFGTASYADNANLLDGLNSTVFATTGSNIFIGTQTITGSVNISGSTNITQVTGSFTGSFIGSLTGTSSWATNTSQSISSSVAISSSYANISANSILFNSLASSIFATTGSNIFIGTETITGSVNISGSTNITQITGSFTGSFRGPLTGSFSGSTQNTSHSGSFTGSSFVGNGANLSGSISGSLVGVLTGSFSGSGNGPFTGSFSGALAGTASYANNADLLDGLNSTVFATTGSNIFIGTQTITGSVNISGSTNITQATGSFTGSFTGPLTGTASWASNVISASYATTASYALNAGGTTTGSYTGSFAGSHSGSFTGSFIGDLTGTSSWAVSASWAPGGVGSTTGSYTGSFKGDHTGSFTGSSFIGNGANLTGSFTGSFLGDGTGLTGVIASAAPGGPTSSIQFNNSGSTSGSAAFLFDKFTNSVVIGTGSFHSTAQELLRLNQPTGSSFNLITAYSNTNNYSQVNIQNLNAGTSASSDFVATKNDGTETSGFINMGINGSTFSNGNVGTASDAYLYSTSERLLIGNAATGSNANIYLFAGGYPGSGSIPNNVAIFVSSSDQVGINTVTISPNVKLEVSGNVNINGRLSGPPIGQIIVMARVYNRY